MKKFLSVVACAASLAAGLSTTAAAEVDYKGYKLPFEVKAPLSVSLGWVEGDSDTTLQLAFSTDNELNQWLNYYAENTTHDAAVEKLHKEYQIDELFVNAQVDWAIDDPVNGWHYTPYWDGETWKGDDGTTQVAEFGMDKNYQYRIGSWDLVSEGVSDKETVTDSWILRGIWVYDPETTPDYTPEMNAVWLGTETTPGLKDQLKEDQYTLVPTGDEPGEYKLLIDYTQHTAYVRVRYGITVRDMKDNSQHIFSDCELAVNLHDCGRCIDVLSDHSCIGQDLTEQLRGEALGERLLISSSMLDSAGAVFLDDLTFLKTLGTRGAYVILTDHLQHAGAGLTCVAGYAAHTHAEHRHHHLFHAPAEVHPGEGEAPGRQQLEP